MGADRNNLPRPVDPDPHDPGAEAWKPKAGPLPWERETEAVRASWKEGEYRSGIGVRGSVDGDNEEWIVSTVFAPDLLAML